MRYFIIFCVSVDMGTCIIFFYTLCTLRHVYCGNFLLDFLHTYFVKHAFVDGSCHNHEGMLVLLATIEYFIQCIMLFTLFCERRCRASSSNVLDATSVAETLAG